MLRKAKHYWALPYTGQLTLVLGIQRGVCLTHHKIVADRNSALFWSTNHSLPTNKYMVHTTHTKNIETLKTVTWLSKIKMSLQGFGKHCISGTAVLVMNRYVTDLTPLWAWESIVYNIPFLSLILNDVLKKAKGKGGGWQKLLLSLPIIIVHFFWLLPSSKG